MPFAFYYSKLKFGVNHTMKWISYILFFLCFSQWKVFAADEAANKGVSQSGQKVFAKVLPYVFKVKTSPTADSPQASYGTGFVVDKSGLLITNYHVVSDSIVDPQKNKIFVMMGDEAVPAQVLAVNIVQDVSLIRIAKTFDKALPFATRKPSQGEPIFSIGQPEDLNMAIVDGTYNDELVYGKYQIIHLSAPINSGMSGGPTVNANGELIGINVSKRVMSSNLSFAVPARFAKELYEGNKNLKEHTGTFWEDMEKQLIALQSALTEDLLASSKEVKTFEGWKIPQAPKSLKCWSVNDSRSVEDRGEYDLAGLSCDLQHSAYLSSEMQTGSYSIDFKAIDNKQLNAWRFYRKLDLSTDRSAFSSGGFWSHREGPKLQTTGDCISNVLVTSTGVSFKVAYCARAYSYFPQLQDAHVQAMTIGSSKNALRVDLEMQGFTKENILKVVKQYTETVARGSL